MSPSSEAERLGVLETRMDGLVQDVHEIKDDVRGLRSELAGRPTWSVLMIIAGLGSLSTALGTTLLMLLVNQ